jgi:hypothetical protein
MSENKKIINNCVEFEQPGIDIDCERRFCFHCGHPFLAINNITIYRGNVFNLMSFNDLICDKCAEKEINLLLNDRICKVKAEDFGEMKYRKENLYERK